MFQIGKDKETFDKSKKKGEKNMIDFKNGSVIKLKKNQKFNNENFC